MLWYIHFAPLVYPFKLLVTFFHKFSYTIYGCMFLFKPYWLLHMCCAYLKCINHQRHTHIMIYHIHITSYHLFIILHSHHTISRLCRVISHLHHVTFHSYNIDINRSEHSVTQPITANHVIQKHCFACDRSGLLDERNEMSSRQKEKKILLAVHGSFMTKVYAQI